MKQILLSASVILSLTIAISCSSPQDKISELENTLFADSSMTPDTAKSNKIIGMYLAFADKNPTDTLSPVYLFKAGDLASKMNETHMAIQIFESLKKEYPDHRNAPYALFLQGFISENQEGNPLQARPYYEEFLKKYPDHIIAHDVAFSLENLGKTPEELIMEFEKMNASENSDSTATKPAI
jgi:tetratricopeptide (TPR) repeat protein